MQAAPQDKSKILSESIHNWWRDAGVDYVCGEEPANWLVKPFPQLPKSLESTRHAAKTVPLDATLAHNEWPIDFLELKSAIFSDVSLPGNNFGSKRATPHAVQAPELMVLLDFPEDEDLHAGSLGHGPVGKLLNAMLKACGFTIEKVYLGALAYSRPASGALSPTDLPLLADFARHQIKVARPQQLLFLGTAVSEALLGQELIPARTGLPEFNQIDGILTVMATFHPRTLLARPVLKAQAWQDLQRIVQKDQA